MIAVKFSVGGKDVSSIEEDILKTLKRLDPEALWDWDAEVTPKIQELGSNVPALWQAEVSAVRRSRGQKQETPDTGSKR